MHKKKLQAYQSSPFAYVRWNFERIWACRSHSASHVCKERLVYDNSLNTVHDEWKLTVPSSKSVSALNIYGSMQWSIHKLSSEYQTPPHPAPADAILLVFFDARGADGPPIKCRIPATVKVWINAAFYEVWLWNLYHFPHLIFTDYFGEVSMDGPVCCRVRSLFA